ncbi:hypothetical protein GE09DRAFT_1074719 [Coniochaeta sp. 2T2.1]|nr:hypothetical protein GE09DRAFT_1074719 [Coniochaeta sp. 2T2.1]
MSKFTVFRTRRWLLFLIPHVPIQTMIYLLQSYSLQAHSKASGVPRLRSASTPQTADTLDVLRYTPIPCGEAHCVSSNVPHPSSTFQQSQIFFV